MAARLTGLGLEAEDVHVERLGGPEVVHVHGGLEDAHDGHVLERTRRASDDT